jgi:adenine-specific DNA methylase
MATLTAQKALGAFYTSDSVARFLVRWAIKDPNDTVLDPSCGAGVFLFAAVEQLKRLRGHSALVYGVDLDVDALKTARQLNPHCKFLCEDFFSLERKDLPEISAVVGNPPFIRYQSFNGAVRESAIECARRAGVELPRLTSSWAPFLIHAAQFVRPGGRLAMVVPAEIGHAQYAQNVLQYLVNRFGNIRVCLFRKKLFPELSEDTHLLLASERGGSSTRIGISAFENLEQAVDEPEIQEQVEVALLSAGKLRLVHHVIPRRTRELYKSLSETSGVERLGQVADVGIGYVTGFNDFFHLSENEAATWQIPKEFLRPAVDSLVDHCGLEFSVADWNSRKLAGEKVYLLLAPCRNSKKFPRMLNHYLQYGRKLGAHLRFKCRVREPWFHVPHVRVASCFLSYMSGSIPKLVLNPEGYVAPNTLHLVQFLKGREPKQFASGWYSSLSRLSCEMEGHALGGGMLKLEPTEAERILIAAPSLTKTKSMVGEINSLLRANRYEVAKEKIDLEILRKGLGLSSVECARLSEAALQLEKWRLHR